MATAHPQDENPDTCIFETLHEEIKQTFDNLIKQIVSRRDDLLKEIRMLQTDFQEKIKSQQRTLKDLENIRIQLQDASKDNASSNYLQSSLAPVEDQIDILKSSLIQSPKIEFTIDTQILDMLRDLGKLEYEGEPTNYVSKWKAKHIFDIEGVDFFHINETRLYVVYSSKIIIYDANNWEMVSSHNFEKTKINALAITKDQCYIVERYEIKKLTKDEFQFIKNQKLTGGSNKKTHEFTSIAVSSENELFVVDKYNNRICVFDSNLYHRRDFGTETLEGPTVVTIKEDKVIIKDNSKELHLFNKQGDNLRNLPEYGDISVISWFCFDAAFNIVYSYNNCVRIVSPKGELLKTIGSEVKGCEDVKGCGPIALYGDSIIVACSAINCIKIF